MNRDRVFVNVRDRVAVVDASSASAFVVVKRAADAKPWSVLEVEPWGSTRQRGVFESALRARAHAKALREGRPGRRVKVAAMAGPAAATDEEDFTP